MSLVKSFKAQRALLACFVFLASLLTSSVPVATAAGATLYVSPSSKSVKKGDVFSLSVRVNSGSEPVNAVEANISYSPSNLQYISTAYGSSFSGAAPSSTSPGSIKFVRTAAYNQSVSGDNLVATITLKALSSSGTNAFTINSSGSGVTSGNYPYGYLPLTVAGSIISFSPATVTSSPSNGGSNPAPTTSGGGTSTTPDNKKDQDPAPNIAGDLTVNAKYLSAVVSLKTDINSKVTVKYGAGGKTDQSVTSKDFSKTHDIKLGSELLAGTKYSYIVILESDKGKQTTLPTKTFSTQGFTVSVRITDINNNPLKNIEATLYSEPQTTRTDQDGVATFNNVPAGQHTIEVSYDDIKLQKAITVDGSGAIDLESGSSLAAQKFALLIPTSNPETAPSSEVRPEASNPNYLWLVILLILLILSGGFIYLVVKKKITVKLPRKKAEVAAQPVQTPVQPEVIIPNQTALPPVIKPDEPLN